MKTRKNVAVVADSDFDIENTFVIHFHFTFYYNRINQKNNQKIYDTQKRHKTGNTGHYCSLLSNHIASDI